MTATWSGKTAAARSRKVSGVSGWKFAGLRSRSVSYGVGAMAPSSVCLHQPSEPQGGGSISALVASNACCCTASTAPDADQSAPHQLSRDHEHQPIRNLVEQLIRCAA